MLESWPLSLLYPAKYRNIGCEVVHHVSIIQVDCLGRVNHLCSTKRPAMDARHRESIGLVGDYLAYTLEPTTARAHPNLVNLSLAKYKWGQSISKTP